MLGKGYFWYPSLRVGTGKRRVCTVSIGENIALLRKQRNMTQGELAQRIGVARQTVAKWEVGAASPDLTNAEALADVLDVSLDSLVGFEPDADQIPFLPRDKKSFGTCKLGQNGEIRLPQGAIEMFGLQPGDELVVLANPTYGIGICKTEKLVESIATLLKRLRKK